MSPGQVGDRINNYLLQELLGMGSFGEVWKAKHHIFDELVAIKIPTDPQYVRNLQREGVAIHGLRHENIVRSLDLDPYADPPYVIFEYVDGPTLREVIDAHPQGLPEQSVINIFRGLLEALTVAHDAGIVHRDIKPANILLNLGFKTQGAAGFNPRGLTNGESASNREYDPIATVQPSQVKVTDFGLGKIGGLTTASIRQSGSLRTSEGKSISGTIAYMSPEQRDDLQVDQRSDLYACGIVLCEMLIGARPQGHDLPSQTRKGVPKQFDEIFKKCYTRLDRRYKSAPEILADLDRAFGKQSPLVSAASPIPSMSQSAEKHICPNCGWRVHPEDQFCINCGEQQVEQVPRCPACQAYVYKPDNYCIVCGVDLRVKS